MAALRTFVSKIQLRGSRVTGMATRSLSTLKSDPAPTNSVNRKLGTMISVEGMIRIPSGFVLPEPKALRVTDGNYKGAITAGLATTTNARVAPLQVYPSRERSERVVYTCV